MIRHIVMFKFLPEADGRSKKENVKMTADMLLALQGVVPTLKASEVHFGAEGMAESNYDLILIADFESKEALDEYIVHPKHKAVGAFMGPLRESRTCIDYEI